MASRFARFALLYKPTTLRTFQQIRHGTTSQTGAFLPEPQRTSYGLLSVGGTVMLGLFVGATISQNIASFLEENELFVPSDDDDDDD